MKCRGCGEDVDELVSVQMKGLKKKLCEECAEEAEIAGEIEEGAYEAMHDMMDFKGKW